MVSDRGVDESAGSLTIGVVRGGTAPADARPTSPIGCIRGLQRGVMCKDRHLERRGLGGRVDAQIVGETAPEGPQRVQCLILARAAVLGEGGQGP